MVKYILKVLLLTIITILSSCNNDEACDQQVWYEDVDGDSFGNPNLSMESESCNQPTNFVLDNTDCDDNNFNINPSALEVLDNDVDENCEGVIEQTIFPYQVGNKWYYEKNDNSGDIWIYESVDEELVGEELKAKIKVTYSVLSDVFSYTYLEFEFNPEYYQYLFLVK